MNANETAGWKRTGPTGIPSVGQSNAGPFRLLRVFVRTRFGRPPDVYEPSHPTAVPRKWLGEEELILAVEPLPISGSIKVLGSHATANYNLSVWYQPSLDFARRYLRYVRAPREQRSATLKEMIVPVVEDSLEAAIREMLTTGNFTDYPRLGQTTAGAVEAILQDLRLTAIARCEIATTIFNKDDAFMFQSLREKIDDAHLVDQASQDEKAQAHAKQQEAKKQQDAAHETEEKRIETDKQREVRNLEAAAELDQSYHQVLRAHRQLSEQYLIDEFQAKRRKDALAFLKEEIEFFRTSREKERLAEALRHVATEVNLDLEKAEIENEERRAKAKRLLDFELLNQLPALLEKLQQPTIDQLRILQIRSPTDVSSSSTGTATQLPFQVMQGFAILKELLRFLDEGA